jgi:hypothetical protein
MSAISTGRPYGVLLLDSLMEGVANVGQVVDARLQTGHGARLCSLSDTGLSWDIVQSARFSASKLYE